MKFLEFVQKNPISLVAINVPVLVLLFERFLLNALRQKTKSKTIEELIDESWAQQKKEKQSKG